MKRRMMLALGLFVVMAFALSCADQEDEQPAPAEYRLTVGDTTITIGPSAVAFVRGNFNTEAYTLREYQVASRPEYHQNTPTYTGDLNAWRALPWTTRQTYLLPPFTRDWRTTDAAQFYYWIGTNLDQFGFGWKDTFDPEASLHDPTQNIWTPADTTLPRDNPGTIGFDGESRLAGEYRALWTISF